MSTGERIKEARIVLGMTQSELADKIDVKFSAIHKYENGLVVNLKRDTIEALAKALYVKPPYLMCIDDDSEPVQPLSEADFLTADNRLSPEDRLVLVQKILDTL